jgi:hypothetical protein
MDSGEGSPRATTAQQCSKGLILLKKQTTRLSNILILHAYEIGTFCIDCTGTPGLLMCVQIGTYGPHMFEDFCLLRDGQQCTPCG